MARAKSSKASTSKASKSETKSQAEGETKQKSKAKAKGATAAKAQTKVKSTAGRTKARREKPDVIGTVGPTGAAAAEMGFASSLSSGFFSNESSGDFTAGGAAPAAAPEPASRYDGVLGQLTWNAELRSYHGKVDFKDRQVDVCLVVEDRPEQLETMLSRAREVVTRIDDYANRAEAYAASKLDEVERGVSSMSSMSAMGYDGEKESCCTADDGSCAMPPADKSQFPVIAKFNRTMRLKSIEFRPDGTVTFLHDDGNAFWGHLVEVTMNPDDQLTDARLAA